MKTQLFAVVFLAAGLAQAHHSVAGTYFADKEVELHGTIAQFLLRNPHSYLLLDAPDASGQMQRWEIEWGSAAGLAAHRVGRNTLMPGDEVAITIFPPRKPEDHRGLLKIIRRPSDGFEWGTKPGEINTQWLIPIGTGGTR